MSNIKFKDNEQYSFKEIASYLLKNFQGDGFENELKEIIDYTKAIYHVEDIKFNMSNKSYEMVKKLSKIKIRCSTLYINANGLFVLQFENVKQNLKVTCILLENNKIKFCKF